MTRLGPPVDPVDDIVGIDQTGAARRRGQAAAPLPAARCRWDGSAWTLTATEAGRPWRLRALAPEELGVGPRSALLVDAVLGLPAERAAAAGLPPGRDALWALAARAAAFDHQGRRYGRAVGEAFLRTLEGPGPELREVDALVGAHSVFRSVPYQRNVQTGSFRIWRDLGEGPVGWCRPWPDGSTVGPWLMEAWPTLAWREAGHPTRSPTRLGAWCARWGVALADADAAVLADADHADAAVNALHGAALASMGRLLDPGLEDLPPARREGWIAGVVPPRHAWGGGAD